MRKRSKALILIFNYSELVADGNLKVLQDSGLDYQLILAIVNIQQQAKQQRIK